jgi:hypothetical protein
MVVTARRLALLHHLTQIAAGTKRAAVPGDQHSANRGILVATNQRVQQRVAHLEIQRVVCRRPVERDHADAIGRFKQNCRRIHADHSRSGPDIPEREMLYKSYVDV